MQFWLGLAAGLLIGWLTEGIFGWRRRLKRDDSQLPLLSDELGAVRSGESRTEANAASTSAQRSSNDDLTAIKGIGPVFARRLQENGIHSFAALAAATPEQLRVAVKAASWQQVDPEDWIEQAKRLLAA